MTFNDFSDATLRTLLERFFATSFHAIVITTAADGHRIIYVNPQFCRMTGYAAEELIGNTPAILQGEKTNPKIIARLKASLERGQPFHGATINYRKDGQPYPVEWNITPIHNEEGAITHFISIQKDLSQLKDIVTRLKTSNQHFRRFLRDIMLAMDENSADARMLSQHKQELTEELLDNSRLYNQALRSPENIELFGETEFFDCDHDLSGMLGEEAPAERVSAAEYCRHFTTKADIRELLKHIDETRAMLDILPYSKNVAGDMRDIGRNIQDMANEIFYFEDFIGISSALAELAHQTARHAGQPPAAFILEIYLALLSDLHTWVRVIFLEQSAGDIHEMDASIISSAKQLLMMLKG